MRNIMKKAVIALLFVGLVFTGAYALNTSSESDYTSETSNFGFIEDMKLDSSRYSRVDDLSIVDEEYYITIKNSDELIASNNNFELYFTDDDINFKILNKDTGYVWSSGIPRASAGTYSPLLESGIGFDYINVEKNMTLSENIGIQDTVYTFETTDIENGIRVSLDIDAYCATRRCNNWYDGYLEGKYSKEEMLEVGLTELGFKFDLEVTLDENGVVANVPLESIEETRSEEVLLSSFIIFPGMGATEMDEIPGYMVLPEGSGTLIRYEDNEGKYISPFEERFYGQNYGLYEGRDSVLNYPLSMPIFGAVHGVYQNAMVGIIESGDINARLIAFPNGALNIDHNLVYTKIDFRQVYRQPFTSDGSQGTMKQLQTLFSDSTIRYNFLSDDQASYVGIGSSYRNYLTDSDVLTQKTSENNIPISIEYFMSDAEQTFFGSSVIEATTVEEVREMYDYLMENGVVNQEVLLTGWNDGGFSGYLPSNVDFENKLGSNRAFRDLIAHINQDNQVTLYNDFVIARQANNDISYRNDVAAGTNRTKVMLECDDCVSGDVYFLYPSVTEEIALKYYADFLDEDVKVLFDTLGNGLISYYKRGYYTREDSLAHYENVMAQYEGTGSYAYPFSYAYAYTDTFYYTPLYNSQLKYYDDLIPLLQIVLHGSMDLYSSNLNFNSLGREQILALVDFGMSPSFIVTDEPASELKDTDSSYLYTTEFDLWKGTIIDTYDYVNNALKHVDGAYIVRRDVIESGIVEVEYSNGVSIYINYTTTDYSGDVNIAAMDYYVGGVSE